MSGLRGEQGGTNPALFNPSLLSGGPVLNSVAGLWWVLLGGLKAVWKPGGGEWKLEGFEGGG